MQLMATVGEERAREGVMHLMVEVEGESVVYLCAAWTTASARVLEIS